MDTKVTDAVVMKREHGSVPVEAITFYSEDKPVAPVITGFRHQYYYFKKDKKNGTKRESMMVRMTALDCEQDGFTGVEGHKFLNALVADYQDSVIGRSLDGEVSYENANLPAFLVKDYFDTSRTSSGRKITKESIMEWYLEKVGAIVAARALTKNAQMKEESVANVVRGFGEMFQRFTKYDLVNIFTAPQFTLIRNLVTEAKPQIEAGDEMLEWIEEKIAKIVSLTTAQDSLVDAI